VTYLAERGIDINAVDDNQRSLLSLAAEGGFDELVEYLIEQGADVFMTDASGRRALSLAEANEHDQVVELLSYEMEERTV
jgi:ankyrin repeat protein